MRLLFKTLFLLLLMGNVACSSCQKESKVKLGEIKTDPNVIIIVADQMRRQSMGFWQQDKYQTALNGSSDFVVTPNIDLLANEGVVFTQAIANYPLCSPFRGMLLSGMYPNNNGVTNNTRTDRPSVGLRTDITTLTDSLFNAGYNTALVGKGHWHNNLPLLDKNGHYVGTSDAPGGHFFKGTRYDTYIPPGAPRHSIEYWYQSLGHNHDNPVVYTNDQSISGKPDGQPFYPRRYSAVDQADVIVDYINNSRQQRDNKKPFSLLWTMDPPHSPYKEIEDTDEQIFNQYYRDIDIETLLNRGNADVAKASPFARYHFSMVTLIDREIGRVMKALKQQGLAENTLIVFTSDHGEMMGSHGLMSKNVVYEESLGIPLIVHYPSKLNHHINDLLISVPDFMPTVLGILGLQEEIPASLDGTDFSQYLSNPTKQEAERKSSLYYGKNSEYGVRTLQYTYAVNAQGKLIALFDNKADPYQLTQLSFTDIPSADAQLLKQELAGWLKHINHPWYKQSKFPNMITYP
jgi:arylsulfatase A-like enzyme